MTLLQILCSEYLPAARKYSELTSRFCGAHWLFDILTITFHCAWFSLQLSSSFVAWYLSKLWLECIVLKFLSSVESILDWLDIIGRRFGSIASLFKKSLPSSSVILCVLIPVVHLTAPLTSVGCSGPVRIGNKAQFSLDPHDSQLMLSLLGFMTSHLSLSLIHDLTQPAWKTLANSVQENSSYLFIYSSKGFDGTGGVWLYEYVP